MRKLVILRGAMGSGKSTFIKKNNLDIFTLSSDKIRLMFTTPQISSDYKEEIPQFNNKKVWELLYNILEERMKRGEFTIIDASHVKTSETFSFYKKLAEKYRYRLYVIDFTDIPKEEVHQRNLAREEYKIVPKYVIDRAYKIFAKEKVPKAFKVIKPEEFHTVISTKAINYDKYNKVHIVGDIHGCFSALKKYFDDNPINKNEAYIFTGDYFDRGVENYQTFKYLSELMENENMTFLTGNHEDKLYKYACGDIFKMDYDIQNTILEFEENNISKKQIRAFIKKLAQVSFIDFSGKTYLITHGGLPYMPKKSLDFYSTNTFIYGACKYEEDVDKLYNDYMEREDKKIYQIHGHQNYHKIKTDKYKYSFNLDGDVEHGNNIRVLTLNKDGNYNITEIKNEIYNHHLTEETKVYNLIEDLRANKYVLEKNQGNDISSFNFSKEAFYHKIWNDMTIKARGLFIDTKNYKIVARSYNKFFNVNEREETKLQNLEKSLIFPVNFYLKYNGFLGLLSVYNDEFFFATKSVITGEYTEVFKKIFYQKYSDKQREILKNKIIEDNITIVFEVIDPTNDPHIIEYEKSDIVILDMIYNKADYTKFSYEKLEKFAHKYDFKIKELIYTANDNFEFISIYNKITAEDYKLNEKYIEGFVVEDSNNFMIKTKTTYYNTWKYLRKKMENAVKKNNYKVSSQNYLEKLFMEYLKNKYENTENDITQINIIAERKDFENFEKNNSISYK